MTSPFELPASARFYYEVDAAFNHHVLNSESLIGQSVTDPTAMLEFIDLHQPINFRGADSVKVATLDTVNVIWPFGTIGITFYKDGQSISLAEDKDAGSPEVQEVLERGFDYEYRIIFAPEMPPAIVNDVVYTKVDEAIRDGDYMDKLRELIRRGSLMYLTDEECVELLQRVRVLKVNLESFEKEFAHQLTSSGNNDSP